MGSFEEYLPPIVGSLIGAVMAAVLTAFIHLWLPSEKEEEEGL